MPSSTAAAGAASSSSTSASASSAQQQPPLSKAEAKKAAKKRLEELERARQEKRKKAMLGPDGSPRDVLAGLQPFAKYERQGLDLTIECTAPGLPSFTPDVASFVFDLTKANMEALYNAAPGWGWKDTKKRAELMDGDARYLVARERGGDDGKQQQPVAFVHFRFLLEGAFDVLYVYELQLAPQAQRKGLGKHLMQIAEMVARQSGMQM
jgi:hypothetical protein